MKKTAIYCPRCASTTFSKNGIINGRQRYKCKPCNYNFTVQKNGKCIDHYYVLKAMQLYIEGIALRQIERILNISHVTIMNIVKKYNLRSLKMVASKPQYTVMTFVELIDFFKPSPLSKAIDSLISNMGNDKYIVIFWERMG